MRPICPVFEVLLGNDPTASFIRSIIFIGAVVADMVLIIQVVIN
jgi:hypothetical protein